MSDLALFTERHCARAFLATVPEKATIEAALTAASYAPSSKNGQPWKMHLAVGASADRVREALCAAFDAGTAVSPEYRYSPAELPAEQMERARKCGFGLFAHKGIGRDDKPARKAHDRENYRLFGAPAVAVLSLPQVHEKGTFLDGGLFLGQFMLALRSLGLESTPMFSVACYPQVLRQELSIPDDRLVVCAVAFGYEDKDAHVNGYRTERESLEGFVSWA